ncbi:uncharacterized protein LOC114791184 [Denticeps clupeoides]|uniref:uncharacterized protein LOC114791184 n=1 Tax=Denticeps clupeoides TaxID=299321 RepID=UPI0010A4A544|nr:uncharacterized protein LOC114791184 [Denticeps clupeoides]
MLNLLITSCFLICTGACDHIVLKQPEVVGIQEGETAVLPCHISPPNANLSKTTRRWWFGKRGSGTVGVFPLNNYSSPEHSGRVQLHDPGDRNSLSLELTRAQMSDQQTYFCSLSLIYNGDYQLVTGNGTTLFVYGPLELTRSSCSKPDITLCCQVAVHGGDGMMLSLQPVGGGEVFNESNETFVAGGQIMLKVRANVPVSNVPVAYSCQLSAYSKLLLQQTIQLDEENVPVLFLSTCLAVSAFSIAILCVSWLTQRREKSCLRC